MRSKTALASLLAGLGACTLPGVAHAQLAAAFADAVTVDTEYLTGANSATDIAFSADGRAVVTLKGGTIVVRRADGTKNMQMGVFGNVDTQSEKGLLGVVADPGVATNNTFYFYVSNGSNANDKHRVYRGVLSANDTFTIDMADPVIAEMNGVGPGLRGPANHDGGGLFIHEGQLYVGVGDTGANATPPTNKFSSCLNLGNGKILRVNLDGSVPTDNPLVGESMVTSCTSTGGDWGTAAPDTRVYAWGFRNPWRFWVDPHTGLMWIGDVGETTREEISVGRGNQHYGYPFNEGTREYGELDGKDCMTGFAPGRECTPPVYDYGRADGANCVIGGLIPEGCGWTNAFDGKLYYLFADHGARWVRALEVRPDRTGVVSTTAVEFGTFGNGPASFRQGPDGAFYLVHDGAGAVYRFAPTNLSGPDCMGGMGGAGGTGGSGGAGATGGSSGGGGVGVTGGSATGGSSGAAGRGGTSAGNGDAGAGGGSDDDGGCGCRVAGRSLQPFAFALLALGVAAAFARRLR
ncbi:MAG TPA: PQQ-dependent sugar dehydrogenase [Polyangiaceae bacterium]